MLTPRKRFRERDPRKVGLAGLALVGLLLAVALTSGSIYRALTSTTYTAMFGETGGLTTGADVRIAGFDVGKVQSINLDGAQVKVSFSVQGPGNLGTLTGAAIKTSTALGLKFLAVLPAGGGQLPAGAVIPRSRTSSPYDLSEILGQLTQRTEQLNGAQLAQALNTVAGTFQNTPQGLAGTLDGVNRLSQSVADQDQALRNLLSQANTVTGVLAQRNRQLSQLFDDGNLLFGELNSQRTVIDQLLVSTTSMLDQLNGLVRENQPQLQPALQQLQGVLNMLNRDNQLIGSVVQGVNIYAGTLGEAVGGGPWFYGYLANLPPTNLAPLLPDVLKAVGP
ncbi:MAG TPA: MlaD family protein [Pseudonocardiaceae bacterium]|jgi:phospholipid/cholesterol/gamma-HCH transport system substrate-binding protein|nr:MlaD family protein [Pseudonocardiaceae bacterium]